MSSPLTADTPDAIAVADALARYQVVKPARLDAALADYPGGDGAALADHLLQLQLLTPFQAQLVAAGRTAELAVGPYTLTGVLGRGAFGPLFRATERAGRGAVAVRVLPLRSLWQAKQARAVVRAFAALPPHPALVPLADVGSARGCHYVVWPFADGERLTRRVRGTGPLPTAAVARLVARLAGGLAVAHRRGLAHGLVTPRAVLIGPDGEARLLESGAGQLLARSVGDVEPLLDTLTAALAVAGMLDCAAPEWLLDPTAPTELADQFGLGCVAHFALTGRYPFPGRTIPERVASRRQARPVLADTLSGVPPALTATIGRMLDPDPAGRFTSLDDLLESLADAVDGLPGAADPADTPGGGVAVGLLPSHSCASASAAGSRAGGWAATGSGLAARPAEGDGSAASVSFDLPAEPDPAAAKAPPPGANAPPAAPKPPPDLQIEFHHEPDARTELAPAETLPRLPAVMDTPSGAMPRPDAADPPPASDPPTPRLLGLLGRTGTTPPPPVPLVPFVPFGPVPPPAVAGTGAAPTLRPADPARPVAADPDHAPPPSVLLGKLKKVMFWQAGRQADEVEVSVFGPLRLTPGEAAAVEVFVHLPEKAGHIRTLARAMRPGVERIGGGRLAAEVARGSALAVHLSASTGAVAVPLISVPWKGETQRCEFELRVPWDAGAGPAPAVVSVGRDNVRIGKADLSFHILPKKG